jgi:DNA replication protein DnaC
MADMTARRPRTKVPPKIDPKDWRERIPASILAEAEAEGPADWDSHSETPEQAVERHKAAALARAQRWLEQMPAMYAEARLGDLDPATHLAIGEWLNADGTTLVLAGQVGTGKTHAAYAVGHHLLGQGLTVEAWTLSDLLAAMRPDGDPKASDLARACDVLILDDLGAAKASEWAQEQLTALLDARLRDKRRQVVTTNAPYEALEAAWGSRAMDRLRYRWAVVTFTGESRRKAAW